MKHAAAIAFALAAATAAAAPPDEMPAEMPSEQPAAAPQPAPPAAGETPAENVIKARGATIIGDDETPLGLYIMPWRSSEAASGLDRPARLLDDSLVPLDPDVFRRQVAYNQALSDQLRRMHRITPKTK